MNDNIHILTFDIGNRLFGIDLEEIVRVIPLNSAAGANAEDFSGNGQEAHALGELMQIRESIEYCSIMIVRNPDMDNLVVKIPLIIDILGCGVSGIMVVPELVRNKQKPFFVWGFLADKGKMITLITFTFMKK